MPGDANTFSTSNEKHLHAELKAWLARPGDCLEESIDGYVIDLVRGDLLMEVQTRSFGKLKAKLEALLPLHPVRLIYPVTLEKWIRRETADGSLVGRRRSPKHGRVEQIFGELAWINPVLAHPNLSVEVVLIHEEEVRRPKSGLHPWRKGWGTSERRLLAVQGMQIFARVSDLAWLLPPGLPEVFTVRDLIQPGVNRWLAGKMAYCLVRSGATEPAGKRGRSLLYRRSPALEIHPAVLIDQEK